MESDRDRLSDPRTDLDPPFDQHVVIHGLLKVAGSSPEMVDRRLEEIKTALKHGTVINDVARTSRIDGATRADRGKEQ
jgi:hypothetical protein